MSADVVYVAVVIFLWVAAITALAVVFVAAFVHDANRRQNQLLAEFNAANPQFNEDHPEWNRK